MNWQTEYQKWLDFPHLTEDLKNELLTLTDEQKEDAFYKNLEFGTAGMRGIMGVGTNRMNIYTIRKATQGFAQYIQKQGEAAMKKGVVIAHDSRYFSDKFTEEAAKILAAANIQVYIFDGLRPTPELSFAVRHLQAFGGIVMTASHNPKQYNGYKIYDSTGCQYIPEEAGKVIQEVEAVVDELSLKTADIQEYIQSGLISILDNSIDIAYNSAVVATSFEDVPKDRICFVYSALHGTGFVPVKRALDTLGYKNSYYVHAECTPDPTFGKVPYPNPEDSAVFREAILLGNEIHADILLATDPDADRLGIAVQNNLGAYEFLNGNTTGALMTYYILERMHAQGVLPQNGLIVSTVVSSNFAEKIAQHFNVTMERTLTGFKFIGNLIEQYEQTKEKSYIFGFEESYGSLVNSDIARDKDAVQAVVILIEMAAYYKEKGQSLLDVLEILQQQFGYFEDVLENIVLEGKTGAEKIQKIILAIKNKPFEEIAGYRVQAFENYIDSIRYINGTKEPLTLPKSEVLKFMLEDGSWFCLRPSGTEPKAKIYISACGKTAQEAKEKAQKINVAISATVNKIIAPE